MKQTVQQYLAKEIYHPRKAVIVTHRNPDGDAMGSSLGLKEWLSSMGWEVTFISPSRITPNLMWMPGASEALEFENPDHKSKSKQAIEECKAIFCLDFNALSRLEELGQWISQSPADQLMIDHHLEPEDFAAYEFSDSTFASTSEMIAHLMESLNQLDKISPNLASNLYVGMSTDTGFFQFSNTTPRVHHYAGLMIAHGANPDELSSKINNIFTENRLRFFGHCLLNKLKLVNNGRVAVIAVRQQEIKEFNLQQGDNEGLVNYPFKIEGVQVSVLFSEEPGKIKISFRSKGSIDVNAIARTHFRGGGHKNASGGMATESLQDTMDRFLNIAQQIQFNP